MGKNQSNTESANDANFSELAPEIVENQSEHAVESEKNPVDETVEVTREQIEAVLNQLEQFGHQELDQIVNETQEKFDEIDIEALYCNAPKMTYFLNEAYQAAEKGELDRAVQIFEKLIQVELPPFDIQALYLDFLQENRLHERAEDLYKQFIEQSPQDPDIRSNYGYMLWEQGRNREALFQFKQATLLEPAAELFWVDRLNCAEEVLSFGEVDSIYKDALLFHPKHAELTNNYALFLDNNGMHDEAEPEFQKAIEIDKKNPRFFSNFALNQQHLEKFESAEKNHLLAIEYGGDDMLFRNNYAQFLESQGRDEEVEYHYQELLEQDDVNQLFYLTNYAYFLEQRGRKEEARDLYLSYIAKSPNEPAAWNWYGEFLFESGDTEGGIEASYKALDLDPSNSVYKENVSHHLIYGAPDRAEAEFKKLAEKYPENHIFEVYLSWFYFRQGDLPKGYQQLKTLFEKDPENPFVLLHLANFYDGGVIFYFEDALTDEDKQNYQENFYNPRHALTFYNKVVKVLTESHAHYDTFDFIGIEDRIDEIEQSIQNQSIEVKAAA